MTIAGPIDNSAIVTPHALGTERVVELLQTSLDIGLTTAEADVRRARFGRNQLPEAAGRRWWLNLAGQFNQLVVWILIVAAVIAGAMHDLIDAAAILAIVILNGVLGFVQEERAEQALESLRKLGTPSARVRRDGEVRSFPAGELVPGDVIVLEAGDSVPADARLTEAFVLTMQEAALTGESTPVEKDAQAEISAAATPGDRTNMVYFGTTVSGGKATAVVTAVGGATELGRIAGLLAHEQREPTPLQKRLSDLGRVLVAACLAIVGLIAGLLLLRGMPISEVLLPAISLAVAAVPEGLPAVVTVTLALGLRRLVRRNALVRTLPSVETLGSVTVICSDKTGTLTRNEMTVREMLVGDASYQVTGVGYAPHGEFLRQGSEEPDADDLDLALTIGARCNNARLVQAHHGEGWHILGDPTEGALVVAALKRNSVPSDDHVRLELELPFDSTRKMMSTVHREADGKRVLYAKGAPEAVLRCCRHRLIHGRTEPFDDEARRYLLEQNSKMASRALRVLALAYHPNPASSTAGSVLEQDLIFVGLAGMSDPPREEARTAVAICRKAGIRPVMITGDHPATAEAVARELGILDEEVSAVLTGRELDELSDDELDERVPTAAVYARVTAEHKLRIVHAWKRRNQVVAMTGDGVNDAPAVKAADIGIAMGITGTDVTKEASDMVLTDDNFATIVQAVEEGRGVFDNIQKVIHYLLACNAGEVLLMLFAALWGLAVPLTALQILWINLITDGLPALALAVEPPEPNLMLRRPRASDARLISWNRGRAIFLHGVLMALASLFAFAAATHFIPGNVQAARLIAFCVTAFSQLFFALSCRSSRLTWRQLGWFTNPLLLVAVVISGLLQLAVTAALASHGGLFNIPIDPMLWIFAVAASLLPVAFFEVSKWWRRPQGAEVR